MIETLICNILFFNCGHASAYRFAYSDDKERYYDNPSPYGLIGNFPFKTVCYDDIGCFNNGPPFYHILYRPISLPPQRPITTYQLFTSKNSYEYYDLKLSAESINNSTFNPDLQTKFIIHGFQGNFKPQEFLIVNMRNALLSHGDYNIIVVDWAKSSGGLFFQAAANTRTVGAEIAVLIALLMKNTGIEAKNFHLIGFSLGAHVAGYAGERIKGLGQITGLDACGPYFRHTVPQVRLDTSDALHVDVIHTNAGEILMKGFGLSEPIGHLNFYVNGGARQPGCILQDSAKAKEPFCNHFRAVKYYTESIENKNCTFIGVKCNSYNNYLSGGCESEDSITSKMGINNEPITDLKPPSKFYLKTGDDYPFCINYS